MRKNNNSKPMGFFMQSVIILGLTCLALSLASIATWMLAHTVPPVN